MPQFLPPEARLAGGQAANEQYGITTPASTEFVNEETGFISDVAKKMHVEPVKDIGRVPSLFSRIYTFFTDLFPDELGPTAHLREGRQEAQKQARRQFRGIACVLALRHTLQIN